jgi:hypothetical protein
MSVCTKNERVDFMLSNRTENFTGRYPDSLPNMPQELGVALAQSTAYYERFNALELSDKVAMVDYINAAQNKQELDERIDAVLKGFV